MVKLMHNARFTFNASSAEDRVVLTDALDELLEIKKRVFWEYEDLAEPGFDTIFQAKLWLDKSRQLRSVLENVVGQLSEGDRSRLLGEASLRLDARERFFFRLDADKIIADAHPVLVDRGNVVQVRLNVAAFPKREDRVLEVLEMILAGKS